MPALWLASLRQKSQSRSYGGTKESVIQNAIPAAARQAKTKPARHSAKRRLPMSTPTTSLLTMLVATAIKVARAALCADMPVSFVIETGDGVDVQNRQWPHSGSRPSHRRAHRQCAQLQRRTREISRRQSPTKKRMDCGMS